MRTLIASSLMVWTLAVAAPVQGLAQPGPRAGVDQGARLLAGEPEPGARNRITWGLSRFSRSENGTVSFRNGEVVLLRIVSGELEAANVGKQAGAGANAERQRAHAWWDDRTAGLIGGIGGSLIGCLGGLIGTLAGLGRARRLALGLAYATVGFGLACLLAGAVALSLSQPWAVYYPLLLGGGICTVVMGCNLPTMRRRYAEIELRRMEAMDVDAAGHRYHAGPDTRRKP